MIKVISILALFVASFSQVTFQTNKGCRKFDVSGNCQECSFRFYRDSNKECQLVDPICRTWDSNTGACTACYAGYRRVENTCILAISISSNLFDPLCSRFQNEKCVQCSRGSYMNRQGICIAIDEFCRNFDLGRQTCTECYLGYTIGSNGLCQLRKNVNDPYCKTANNSRCTECFNRFFFNPRGQCEMVNSLCKTYNMSNGNCLSCFIGFNLRGNSCVFDNNSASNPENPIIVPNNTKKCQDGSIYFPRTQKCGKAQLCLRINPVNQQCQQCKTNPMTTIKETQCRLLSPSICTGVTPQACLDCKTIQKSVLINISECSGKQ